MAFDSVKFRGTNKFPAAKFSVVGKYSNKKRRYWMTEYNQSWFENEFRMNEFGNEK